MITENINVTELAAMIGILPENKPNKSHNKVPKAKSEYISREIPEVSFVLMVFIACGRKEMVVQMAAAKPKIVTVFKIIFYYFFYSVKVNYKAHK